MSAIILTSLSGEKVKTEKEDLTQHSQDRAVAGNAYSQLNPRDMKPSSDDSGVPWGSFSMKHIIERGRAREQDILQQRSGRASMQGLQSSAGYRAPITAESKISRCIIKSNSTLEEAVGSAYTS